MENIIIKNNTPIVASTLLMYMIRKEDTYKQPHMNGTNYNYGLGAYNKQKKGDKK